MPRWSASRVKFQLGAMTSTMSVEATGPALSAEQQRAGPDVLPVG